MIVPKRLQGEMDRDLVAVEEVVVGQAAAVGGG